MTKWLLAAGVLMPLYSAQATQDPEAVYNHVCGACHSGQLPMAPKKGDLEAWTPRLAKGMETLVQHVTHHPVDERVIPVHNSLTLSRSWIS
jgi:cytochrome c5